MIGSNPVPAVCDYGSAAQYRDLPSEEQIRHGVVPLDSLPAAWWNCMWYDTNKAVNCARYALGVMINEVNTVLQQAGVCVNPSCIDQLYQAIDYMKTTIGNATVAGSVKSSTTPGMVAIDANGYMTANCVGNANNLTTTAHTVVGAINELKATYDCCVTEFGNCLTSLNNSKAPVAHASALTTYGVGNSACYGHLKISDTYTSWVGGATEGVAASQLALHCVHQLALQHSVTLGDTAACPLGTASAGTAMTAARSDHVHPIPSFIDYSYAAHGGPVPTSAVSWAPYFANDHIIYNNSPFYALIWNNRASNGPVVVAPWSYSQDYVFVSTLGAIYVLMW